MEAIVNPEKLCMGCMGERAGDGPCPRCGFDEAKTPPEPHHLPYRTILSGKYLVGKALGEGGFGITYLGWDLNLDQKVAIKEYFPAGMVERGTTQVTIHSQDDTEYFEEGRDKFAQEARTLARLFSLPGIVTVKDFFLENNTAYIAMEYLEGETLKAYLERRGGKLPPEQVFAWMRPVIRSLAQVHRAGLIHRDISPDNIMVTKNGQIKLLDFGAARAVSPKGEKSLSVLLKPGYAPEEQYRTHGSQGPWTDVYALCATLYRCLSGEVPEEPLDRRIQESLKPLAEFGVSLPPGQEAALRKGLSIEAEDRFQTMEELEAALYPEPERSPARKADPGAGKADPAAGNAAPGAGDPPPAWGWKPGNPAPGRQIPPSGNPPSGHPAGGTSAARPGKSWKRPALFLGGAAILAAAVFGVRALLAGGGAEEAAAGNLLQGGWAAFDRQAVYFTAEDGIYRAPVDGEPEKPEPLADERGFCLARNGSYLYFLDASVPGGEGQRIQRIQAQEGGRPRDVGREDVYGGVFWIQEDAIYYINEDSELCRMSLEGKDPEPVAELPEGVGQGTCVLADGGFYYRDPEEENLFRVSLSDGEAEPLPTGETEQFAVSGGWAYWLVDSELWRMETDGGEPESLEVDADALYNAADGWVYYGWDGELCRIRTDGKTVETLGDDGGSAYLSGRWLLQGGVAHGWRWMDLEDPDPQELWEAPEETEPETEASTEPETQPETEAPTEAPTQAPTEAPTEAPTQAAGEYDPALWVYGGAEFPPLDSVMNRFLDGNLTILLLGTDQVTENQVQYRIDQVAVYPDGLSWDPGNPCLLVQATADLLEGCTFGALSHSSLSALMTWEEGGRVMLCPWDQLREGTVEECQAAADGWTGEWFPEGQTVTLRIPIPAGYDYDSWLLLFSNVSGGEAVGPLYMTGSGE